MQLNHQDVFLLALAGLNASKDQRSLCLEQTLLKKFLTFEEAKVLAKKLGLNSFTFDHWKKALDTIEIHTKHNINVIPIGADLYPKHLEKITNPPKALFVKGNPHLLKKAAGVSIVGSRTATDYGLKATQKIASYFTEKQHTIVSGLASGIDYAAHSSCLLSHGETIAVLGHGLHKIYPSTSRSLADSILDQNGTLVSEHPFGVEPKKHFFVLRNRIQVGLSSFSIIVESKKKSGTMSHANYCLEENHPLYVVLPQNPSPNYEGNIWLHKEKGALPLRSRLDYPC